MCDNGSVCPALTSHFPGLSPVMQLVLRSQAIKPSFVMFHVPHHIYLTSLSVVSNMSPTVYLVSDGGQYIPISHGSEQRAWFKPGL